MRCFDLENAPKRKCPQRGILLHRGRGSTAHAQTSPCYSIGAFIKNSLKALFTIKTPPQSQKNAPKTLFATKKCHQRGIILHRGEGVYCACADFPMLQHRSFHQMCIKEPFLAPKCAPKSLFATKKCHQSPFCHQKMPPEPFLPQKKCHQSGPSSLFWRKLH